jgi:hypothetical protein
MLPCFFVLLSNLSLPLEVGVSVHTEWTWAAYLPRANLFSHPFSCQKPHFSRLIPPLQWLNYSDAPAADARKANVIAYITRLRRRRFMSQSKRSGDPEVDFSDDREYSSAVFLCPRCGNVFSVKPFKTQNAERKCPRCGQFTDNYVRKD